MPIEKVSQRRKDYRKPRLREKSCVLLME